MRTRVFHAGYAVLLLSSTAWGATLTVGPNGQHDKPCAAFAAAQDGDTIELDAAGSYDGDVCAIGKSNLLIRGVNGRAKIDAAGKNSGGKAIWVIQGHDTTIENVELSGCAVPDKNGAWWATWCSRALRPKTGQWCRMLGKGPRTPILVCS